MKPIKDLVKKILKLDAHAGVSSLKNLTYIGFTYHGYHIPANYFDTSSICYCVGAGTDISFDIELVTRYQSQVFIFDPMPYAADHFNELLDRTSRNEVFTIGEGASTYNYNIKMKQMDRLQFIKTGLWNEKKLVRFYNPAQEAYAGHSIIKLQNTDKYVEAEVNTLSNIMKELNHHQIDVLKIEIEGSEYAVIDNILKDKVNVKMILVEFDEFHHRKGKNIETLKRIRRTTEKLFNAGYKLVHSTEYYKRTFIRNDIFDLLEKHR